MDAGYLVPDMVRDSVVNQCSATGRNPVLIAKSCKLFVKVARALMKVTPSSIIENIIHFTPILHTYINGPSIYESLTALILHGCTLLKDWKSITGSIKQGDYLHLTHIVELEMVLESSLVTSCPKANRVNASYRSYASSFNHISSETRSLVIYLPISVRTSRMMCSQM